MKIGRNGLLIDYFSIKKEEYFNKKEIRDFRLW